MNEQAKNGNSENDIKVVASEVVDIQEETLAGICHCYWL